MNAPPPEPSAGAAGRRIPSFLSHLPRDRRGLPVPYVNLWGAEDPTRLSIRPSPAVGGNALFLDDADQTVPDFTRQNMGRQRRCMTEGLCQVCARPVPWSRRFLVVAALSVQRVVVAGEERWVVTEPWLDERCARFAVHHCPALIRRSREEQLELIRVRRQDCQFVMSRGWVEGPLEQLSRALLPIMWVKVALRGVRIEMAE